MVEIGVEKEGIGRLDVGDGCFDSSGFSLIWGEFKKSEAVRG